MSKKIQNALEADRESKYVEFKSTFDPTATQDWCEIIKDIIALSNSGGGVIVFGSDDAGEPIGKNVSAIADIDPADITNKIHKYTLEQFSDFELSTWEKDGAEVVVMEVKESRVPIVFRKPGTYEVADRKQKTAFKEGSVYFRHGAKSAPGNSNDLRRVIEKEVSRVQKRWLSSVGQIVRAPAQSEVIVVSQDAKRTAGGAAAVVRLTQDPNAPAVGQLDPDLTHPYRQKELIERVRELLPDEVTFNSYDVQSIWHAHNIGDHPEFFHTPKFGSTQYSDAYVEWILESYGADNKFFEYARDKYYDIKNS